MKLLNVISQLINKRRKKKLKEKVKKNMFKFSF